MGDRSGSVTFLLADRLLGFLSRIWSTFAQLWQFAAAIFGAFFPQKGKKRKLRPWMIVRRGKGNAGTKGLVASESDVQRLLERMKALDDTTRLTAQAVGFAGAEADYFARPDEVERIIAELIRQNPPFLHIARERPAEDEGKSRQTEVEYLLRDSEIVVTEPQTLFIPQVGVEYLESKRPPGLPVFRSAKTLSDLRAAPLLYQAVPEDYLIARLVEGSVPVMAYREERKYLLFKTEERWIQRRERRRAHVPIEIETGGEGTGTRLMYMLFDRSASLVMNSTPRGSNAVMQLAIAAAMIRADMGRHYARYYFRAFADRLDPLPKDKPIVARTVEEKDRLVQRLFTTNFSGSATRVVEALDTAVDDIERIVESGELGPGVKPRIGLLTDGRTSIYGGVGARMKRLGIELDTILIGKEASYNPELMRISSTISIIDPALYREAMTGEHHATILPSTRVAPT